MAENKPFPDRAAKTLQNKLFDGGLADQQHAIILPQNTTENLATIANVAGSIAYDNEAQQVVVNNGSGFSAVGGGGGEGADQSLSNLTEPTAVNVDLIFDGGFDAHVTTADVDGDDSAALTFKSGDADSGNSGLVKFQSGDVTTSGGSGRVFVNSGNADNGSSGRITIASGAGATASGNITINTGIAQATDGHTGIINLNTGSTSDGAGNTGGINLTTGGSIDGASGNIAFTIGTPSGAGEHGNFIFGTGDVLPANRHIESLGGNLQEWKEIWVGNVLDGSGTGAYISMANATLSDGPDGNNSLDWQNRQLIGINGSTIMFDWHGTNLDAKTHKINNVVNPTSAQDAATKNYVDAKFTSGASGTFTSNDGKTITVVNGLITAIV